MLIKRINVFLLLCVGLLVNTEIEAQDYRDDISNGLSALKEHDSDSALYYFWTASQKGMSQDSLYYFLAEMYISRSVYDTALGLNYAIKAEDESDFKRTVLKQRYSIFSYLGRQEPHCNPKVSPMEKTNNGKNKADAF